MANTLRIKRRAAGGAAGAPASLANAELAFNEQDNTLYYGTGTGGAGGTATSVIAIGGPGAFVGLSGDQTIAGIKTFSSTIAGSISGNAGTATALATARSLGLSGDVTGTASFNGTANATIAATLANSGVTAGSYGSATQVGQVNLSFGATLANSGVTAGTYLKVTVDAKGRVTGASAMTSGDVTGALGYTPANKAGDNFTGSISVSGSITATGDITAYSDARLKTDIETITGALDRVRKLRGVTFSRRDTGNRSVGLIAQELAPIVPEAVMTHEDGLLSVAYGNLVGVLIEAVKDLADKVERLEAQA